MDKDFHNDVEMAIEAYEKVIGNVAIRTREMIIKHGEIDTLAKLISSPDLQKGFQELRDSHQLEKTFEAVVLHHKELFKSEIIEAAQWRLDHAKNLLRKKVNTP
jgi:hypothetical protein